MLLIKEYLWRKSHLSRFSRKLVLGFSKRIKGHGTLHLRKGRGVHTALFLWFPRLSASLLAPLLTSELPNWLFFTKRVPGGNVRFGKKTLPLKETQPQLDIFSIIWLWAIFFFFSFFRSCELPEIICKILCACVKTYFFRENLLLSWCSRDSSERLRTTGYKNTGRTCWPLTLPGRRFHLTKTVRVHLLITSLPLA